mmetsp:Transcript_36270/g.76961  ORF Transcript_36270/g.76961 Transcript_36270/m.76961 type:complete len:297 (+) Transcript_36270:14-904(+)
MGCCSSGGTKAASSAGGVPQVGLPSQAPPASAAIAKSQAQPKAQSNDIVPSKLAQAAKTRVLALGSCELKSIPLDAFKLEELKSVDLSVNKLSKLPDSISGWGARLHTLNLGSNALASLPESVGDLVGLKKLIISSNKLNILPLALGKLTSLQELRASDNSVVELPDCFGSLDMLAEVDLAGNNLKGLPPSFFHLRGIQRLLLSRNKLEEIPPGLAGVKSLLFLDVADNCSISCVPPLLLKNTLIFDMRLQGNKIQRLAFRDTDGYAEFMARRKGKIDQKLDAKMQHIDIGLCGLD